MAEPRDRMSVAFNELAVSVMREVRLPGVDAAHATVRQRRRRRVAIVAAAVAVVILAPVAVVALLRAPRDAGPDIGNTPPSPTASAAPSVTTSPQPAGLRAIADAYARTSTPLDDALLPIPSSGRPECPAGETQYTDGVWQGSMIISDPPVYVESRINTVATGDVNRDGTLDWIAHITCRYGVVQGLDSGQVVAFTRLGNGPYTLLGQVFVPDPSYVASDPEVTGDGAVRLIVTGPYESAEPATSQWRSFRWEDSEFEPAGSAMVIPNPGLTNLTLTVSPSEVSGPTTLLSVTVHNAGPAPTDYLELSFSPFLLESDAGELTTLAIRPEGLPAALMPYGDCQGTADCMWALRLEPVPPGESATGRMTVSVPSSITGGSVFVHVTGVMRGHGFLGNETTRNGVTVPIAAG